jgi:CobQ-like glutamine amidotransferase family enzyme
VIIGQGNNNEDGTEGMTYKNVFGSYFHGPILSRNARLAYRIVSTAFHKNIQMLLFQPLKTSWRMKQRVKELQISKEKLRNEVSQLFLY